MPSSQATSRNGSVPHIFHVIPSFAHGGVPIRISYLANHFGHSARHSLLSTNGAYDCQSRLDSGLDFELIRLKSWGGLPRPWRVLKCRKYLQQLNPDLLLSYHWGAIDWALANSFSPICRHYHLESGFGPDEAFGTLRRRDFFRKLAFRDITGLVVPSNTLVNIAMQRWQVGADKIVYIPNGVDCDKYAADYQEGSIPGFIREPNQVVIGTITPLRPEKNLPRLIRAFETLCERHGGQHFRLVILGEGGSRPHLERLISASKVGAQIHLPGHVDAPDLALGAFDIYGISSDTEQMPNSVNQAMAAALPVAGLDVGDVGFMVSQENKPYVVEAGNEEGFTEALCALALDANLRKTVGDRNRGHVRATFDQSRMFRGYAAVWGVEE